MQKFSDRMHQILFGWSSTPDPTGELTALPRPLAAEEGLAALSQEPTLDPSGLDPGCAVLKIPLEKPCQKPRLRELARLQFMFYPLTLCALQIVFFWLWFMIIKLPEISVASLNFFAV